MSILVSQYVILNYEDFEFTSDEFVEVPDVTLDQLTITFWCDFFKQVFAVAVDADIPALCAIANAIFNPSSKLSREYTLIYFYGRISLSIRVK